MVNKIKKKKGSGKIILETFQGFHYMTKTLIVVFVLFMIAYGAVKTSAATPYVWTPPTGAPLTSNVAAPINVGGDQYKSGKLIAGGLGVGTDQNTYQSVCEKDGTNCPPNNSYPLQKSNDDWMMGGLCGTNPTNSDTLVPAGDWTGWMTNRYDDHFGYNGNDICQHYKASCYNVIKSDGVKAKCDGSDWGYGSGSPVHYGYASARWWPHWDGNGAVACCDTNPICGNNKVESPEICDDGNSSDTVGNCSRDCSYTNLYNVSDAGIHDASGNLIGGVSYGSPSTGNQGGTLDRGVPLICQALKNKGFFSYNFNPANSVHANVINISYCPYSGTAPYQQYDDNGSTFSTQSCWGGHWVNGYTQVYCNK